MFTQNPLHVQLNAKQATLCWLVVSLLVGLITGFVDLIWNPYIAVNSGPIVGMKSNNWTPVLFLAIVQLVIIFYVWLTRAVSRKYLLLGAVFILAVIWPGFFAGVILRKMLGFESMSDNYANILQLTFDAMIGLLPLAFMLTKPVKPVVKN